MIFVKKCVLSLVAALVVLCSVTIFAAAAETDPGITVQLNGKNLEFTDAKPQLKDNRTFLPYRAVFEAMGADVGYEDNVVTAKRGDTELSMTIGEGTATVTRGGVTETLTMDVAPYVDNATWRTYVPVRFAADAFGCSVSWDQAAQTVIIMDVETLVDEALAGKEFTLLEKYMEYSEKYNVGNWAVDGTLDASVSLLGSADLSVLTGTVDGIVSGNTAGEMSMAMDLDLASLMSHIASLTSMSLEDYGFTEEDLRMSMALDMKMDMATGTMYFKMNDAMNAELGLPADAWMSLDLNAIMAESGLEWDYEAMLAQANDIDTAELLKTALAEISLDDQAADAYTTLADTLNSVLTALSDEGFQKTSNGYETTLTLTVEGVEFSLVVDLTTTAADEVGGYSMSISMNIPLDEEIKASLAEIGLAADQIVVSVSSSVDQNDQAKTSVNISMAPLLTADMTVEMNYSTTSQAPSTTLPADAVVVDYMTLMTGIADLQV